MGIVDGWRVASKRGQRASRRCSSCCRNAERRSLVPRQLDARQAPRDPLRRALWLLQVGGRPARGRSRGHPPRLVVGDEHAPRLRALVARDHPAPLEHVDQPARPACSRRASAAAAAIPRPSRAGPRTGSPRRAASPRPGRAPRARRRALGEQLLVELRLALAAALLDDQRDLLLGDEGALDALQPRGARPAGRACRPGRAAPRRRRCRG